MAHRCGARQDEEPAGTAPQAPKNMHMGLTNTMQVLLTANRAAVRLCGLWTQRRWHCVHKLHHRGPV